METIALKRSFSFNGLKLPEPNEHMSVEEVKAFYANQYPELTGGIRTRDRRGSYF